MENKNIQNNIAQDKKLVEQLFSKDALANFEEKKFNCSCELF